MNPSTKDQIAGSVNEAKGKVKETAGHLAGNTRLENEGRSQKLGGKVQKKVGQIEKVLEK